MVSRYGTPEWKSVYETRRPKPRQVWEFRCYDCTHGPKYFEKESDAAAYAENHIEEGHSKTLAGCCMYSDRIVCECGNVLV